MAANPLPLDDNDSPPRTLILIKFPPAADALARPVDARFPEFHEPLRWYNGTD